MGHLFSRLVRYNLLPLNRISISSGGRMVRSAEFAVATPNLDLPVAAAFPRQPATWYLLCRSRQIGASRLPLPLPGNGSWPFEIPPAPSR